MSRKRALFISLTAWDTNERKTQGLLGEIRDFAARGYRVLLVTDKKQSMSRGYTSRLDLLADLRNTRRDPISDVVVLHNSFDPAPFWDAARRHNLSLVDSTIVTSAGEHLAAAKNAGVVRTEPSLTMFGVAA